MRYLMVLDRNSVAGKIYSPPESCDGVVTVGDVQHPVLDCTKLEINPSYVFARHPIKGGPEEQAIHLPHSSVAVIVGYAEEQPWPVGFRSQRG